MNTTSHGIDWSQYAPKATAAAATPNEDLAGLPTVGEVAAYAQAHGLSIHAVWSQAVAARAAKG